VFGLDADIQRLTLKDCIDYHQLRYSPQHVTVTVVGNFDPDRALELARRHFEAVKSGNRREPALRKEPAAAKGRRATERANLPSSLLMVGWRGPARGDPDWPALDLLATILTGGPSSRLHRAMVETRHSCLAVQGDLEGRRDGSLFYTAAAVPPGADSAAVERELAVEIDRLVTEPVTDSELERARNQTEASLLFSLQTTRGRGQALGLFELLNGSYQDLPRHLERMRAYTPADLQRVAARHLGAERRCVVWMTPAGDGSITAPTTGGGRP
jgi:zinc protease